MEKLETASAELQERLSSLSSDLRLVMQVNLKTPDDVTILRAAPPRDCGGGGGCNDEGDGSDGYRCKCTFQLLSEDNDGGSCPATSDQPDRDETLMAYATRTGGSARPLPGGIFPAANPRIRSGMVDLISCLNGDGSSALRANLTSATFNTSWSGADCLVTLMYGPPGLQNEGSAWDEQARGICKRCRFSSVTGRSKGKSVTVGNDNDNELGVIRDDLWLSIERVETGGLDESRIARVSLCEPQGERSASTRVECIRYRKPATAFQHPNAGVMLTSLQWILNTVFQMSNRLKRRLTLLEMYNGLGAHTIPLAKCGFLSRIVAVELDERLVRACRHNVELNDCTNVEVYKGDAAEWAKRAMGGDECCFDVLLVDPPRDGLTEEVCKMAVEGTSFRHMIYISCGRRALLRDLESLCSAFDVADAAVIDLFPGTDAVETLVHLARR